MRKLSLLVLLSFMFSEPGFSQTALKSARQGSWQSFVFRIPADSAEKFVSLNLVNPSVFEHLSPVASWPAEKWRTEELPVGHYLIFSVVKNKVVYEYFNQTLLYIRPVNNNHRVQLEVRDSYGSILKNARVSIGGKEIPFSPAIAGFLISKRNPDESIIKVATPGDTSFVELSKLDRMDSRRVQWWFRFRQSVPGKVLNGPWKKIRELFDPTNRRRSYGGINRGAKGYMIFNQAIYKPGDSVKFKAYILGRRNQRYKKELQIGLAYRERNNFQYKPLTKKKPSSAGSYEHEFILDDSLPSDLVFTVMLKDGKGRNKLSGNFKLEDYINDEVVSHSLRSSGSGYFLGDTLMFYASAKDANGLEVMDGRVRFYLLSAGASYISRDEVFIPDTIFKMEKPLSTDGDTRFEIPSSVIPSADLQLNARAVFLNGNNETHTEEVKVDYSDDEEQISIKKEGIYLDLSYRVNGVSVDTIGSYVMNEEVVEHPIRFPGRLKVHPNAGVYEFQVGDVDNEIELDHDDYTISHLLIQEKDSCGFSIDNPAGLLIHYSVFDGDRVIGVYADSVNTIIWKRVIPANRMYEVFYSFIWRDKEVTRSFYTAALDKILKASIEHQGVVYPGATDTVRVTVTDRKGRPAANVNLTAVTYNSQHHASINVPEPPYLQRMKTRNRIRIDGFEQEPARLKAGVLLFSYPGFRKMFALDTMLYYQMLKPSYPYKRISSVISDAIPQVSVHVVRRGVPQEIHLLYVNNKFVWYNNATDQPPYVFGGIHGYNRFGIRLDSFYILIDSIYLQPFYKHDICFDLDSLPKGTIIEKRTPVIDPFERLLLEQSMIRLNGRSDQSNAWIWQGDKLLSLSGRLDHIIGPFTPRDSVQYFQPGKFDLRFPFEPGYEYRLTPKMARLELKPLYPNKVIPLHMPVTVEWRIGDTLTEKPAIKYVQPEYIPPYLKASAPDAWLPGNSRLKVMVPYETNFLFLVIYNEDTVVIRDHNYGMPVKLHPGVYNVILITDSMKYLRKEKVSLFANGETIIHFIQPVYESENVFIRQLHEEVVKQRASAREEEFREIRENSRPKPAGRLLPYPSGSAIVYGKVIDKSGGDPIPGVTISLNGYDQVIITDNKGYFQLPGIKEGRYYLTFSLIGYQSQELGLNLTGTGRLEVSVELRMYNQALEEVVVLGYGSSRMKSSITGSVSIVSSQQLMGTVAGVSVVPGSNAQIRIRGAATLKNGSMPLIIVNGIVVDEMPDQSVLAGAQVETLRSESAVSVYGSRAANGAIVITTNGFNPKTLRENFRDNASWQPNLFTDKKGQVKYVITYPDNLTGWETYVVGMDRKRRFVKASSLTRSFKPLVAQVFGPSFMIDGDSALFTGKILNYSDETKMARWKFSGAGIESEGQAEISSGTTFISGLPVIATCTDSINARYTLQMANGYGDGESKKIPVLPNATVETIGSFWTLTNDTTFYYKTDKSSGPVYMHAVNNTIDLMLKELDHLKNYPYFCMEQITSKLRGLLCEREIRKKLGQPFKQEKMISYLKEKIQSAQSFDGGWPWWKGGYSNKEISYYIIRTLADMPADGLMQTNIRSGMLYLQQQLSTGLPKGELLDVLLTMTEAKHAMDYDLYLNRIRFDSLTVHQQWQYTRIRQSLGLDISKQVSQLMNKKLQGMLGSVYWGTDNYNWSSNSIATTTLAFRVLSAAGGYNNELQGILNYFLGKRQGGRWGNTVETASILSVIVPYLLKQQPGFNNKANLAINGQQIESFPATLFLPPTDELKINRSGGGIMFLTLSQDHLNKQPEPVEDRFEIKTWFEVSGNKVTNLTAGTAAIMKVQIEVKKDAEYVQVEIPIPAGCTYTEKEQDLPGVHKEYLRDKQLFFLESMKTGIYTYEIRLEPRYSGKYHLVPAKAFLMYFPLFFGRTGIKTIPIEK
ncbi:MAG: carboxypeptidase-like regulatory domain-containing protein [Chitinophagaceae bacterium]